MKFGFDQTSRNSIKPPSPKLGEPEAWSVKSTRWVRCACTLPPMPPLFDLAASALNVPALAALLDPQGCGVCKKMAGRGKKGGGWVEEGEKGDAWVGPGEAADARTGEYLRVLEWVALM